MNHRALLIVSAVVVGLISTPIVGAIGPLAGPLSIVPSSDGQPAAETVEPGGRLAGVVGAENASLNGELERTSFRIQFSRANSSTAKAGVVAAESAAIKAQLERLRERQDELLAAHRNGSIPESAYVAKAAVLAARIQALERRANVTAQKAQQLPVEVLEAKGINVTAIQKLKMDARNLTGQEVADVARTIAGNGSQGGPPDDVGPGQNSDLGVEINQTAERLQRVSDRLNRSADTMNGSAVETARADLSAARQELAAARDALGNNATAAQNHLEAAVQRIEDVIATMNEKTGAGTTASPGGGQDDNPGQGP